MHGYMEHGGRYSEVAERLAAHGLASTAVDVRGHGRSGGARGYVSRFDDYLDDLEAAWSVLDPSRPRFVLAHSFGALIAFDWVARRSPAVAGLVVTNPFLDLTLPPPAYKRVLGAVAGRAFPKLAVPSGIPATAVSRDPAVVSAYANDPYVFGKATAGWFRELAPAQARVRSLDAIPCPLLFVYSDADMVALPSANRALAERLSCPEKTVWFRAGEYHEVLNELDRAELHEQIATWLGDRAAQASPAAHP